MKLRYLLSLESIFHPLYYTNPFLFFFLLYRWAPGASWSSWSNRDVHTGMPRPGTLRQLLDATNVRNIPAAKVTCIQFWLSEGMGTQGQTSQWTYSDQSVEKWERAIGAFWRQEAVWEWRGTLHQQRHGRYSAGESQVLPAHLLPR